MTKHHPRSRALVSALAAVTLLSGALFAVTDGASAAPARTSDKATQADSGPPAAPITSPGKGQVFTPGADISLQAAPLPISDIGKDRLASSPVASVAFYASTGLSDNRLIGVARSAPWTVHWSTATTGDYSLTAVTTDKRGKSTTSTPVAIQVERPSVLIDRSSLAVQQGHTASLGVSLSTAPSSPVAVQVNESGTGVTVSQGRTLTFTPSNWNRPQPVTVAAAPTKSGSHATIIASAAGLNNASAGITDAATASGYDQWFLDLYNNLTNPANGYFSPKGIPYHSVEELIVEAPDYGHETTSETYSYWLWLTADYGRVSGDWTAFNAAWANMQQYMIPNDANQPGCGGYNASSPATYGPEEPSPSDYPVALSSSVPVGSDPLYSEQKSAYGNCDIYAPSWIMDTDNRYGFGQQEDGTSTPSWINSYQRGSEESVWDTIPQPDWDSLKYGQSGSGYLGLFNNGGGSFSAQYKYTEAPDADARLVQAAYWAEQYATAQGNASQLSSTMANAAKLGDDLRYAMFDKYFKQISANCSQVGSASCPAGTSKSNEDTYLMSWYYAWGGSTAGSWSWRISGTEIHQGYQNPMAAYALSTASSLTPLSPSGKSDWATSLTTQLNMDQWLQSAEGAIAGGVTNNWGGNYGDVAKPPSGDPTFDGMYYDWQPVYHNPPSNQWFGFQTWSMERIAEYYYATGNAQAGAILKKWVAWAESVATVNTSTGAICIPGTLTWTGQPAESWTTGTSSSAQPPANPGLHVSVSGCSVDLGVSGSLAKTYAYYAAKSGDTTTETAAQNIIDVIHQFYGDSIGYSAPETRTDYSNFTSAFNTTNYEGVYIPSNWSGTYPGAGTISSADKTFLSIRPWYTSVADYPLVQNYLNGGSAPTFNYHRFWAESDIATAFDTFADLFPTVSPPASATPSVTVTNPGSQTSAVGTAASLQIAATGTTLAYSATDLPLGLSINSATGAITGTPSAAGSYTSVVTVSDGSSASSVNFTWTVGSGSTGNTVKVTNPGNQTGAVGTAVSLPIQATDSAAGATLTYSATGLPAGLSISSSTGLISGTPTAAGTSSVTVTATDGTGAKGAASFTWTVSTGQPPPPSGCHVTYTPNQWPGGFTANVTIGNTGSSAINGWTLTFTFPGDQKITSGWSGVDNQSGENVTITNESYNATIPASGSTSLGFQGTWTSSDASPTSFAVNGSTCS